MQNKIIHQLKKKRTMKITKNQLLLMGSCMIGLASMMLQACTEMEDTRNLLCGNWESVEGKPDVLIYKEAETYLLKEENGNLFMNTGFRIDVSYNEATDILTFSPNGDYIRVKPQPEHPVNEQ